MRALLLLLIRLYPAEFRRRFGADMAEQVATDYERARSAGVVAVLGFGVASAADLLRSAAAEWWSPALRPRRTQLEGRRTMSGVSSGWVQDLRHAVRGLARAPGFTVITVGTLGLAIGANAGIFSVVDTVLLDPLPYAEANRLIHISATAPGSDYPAEFAVSPEFWLHYRENARTLEEVGLYNSFTTTVRAGDRVERIRVSLASASLFPTLGAAPLLGRLPAATDEDRVAVISHGMWVTWFGSDPAVLGRSYLMSGAERTVIGVMPPDFAFPSGDVMLWIPVAVRAEGMVPGRFGLVQGLVARPVPGATHAAIVEELTVLARQLPERFGGSATYARLIEQHRPVVRPLREQMVGDVSRALWVLLGAVGIVLLIACANVANLFMVRAERRLRDQAVRRAIGAGRGRLFRAQITEALVVALLGGVLAVALAWVGVPALVRAAPPGVPRLDAVSISGTTLLFTFAISLVAGLLCGLGPALRASAPNLVRLRAGSRGSTRARNRARDGLVVAQTALALVLLIGSGLLIRSFQALRSVDPGYDPGDVFTFQIAPEGAHLQDGPAYARFHMDFMDRLRALPGVEQVGVVENVPLNESVSWGRFRTEAASADADGGARVGFTFTGGDYFPAMRIALLAGRTFTERDHFSEPGNVIVSRSAAELLWPGEDPLGKRLINRAEQGWQTVVGVVEDVMQDSFRDTPAPLVYYPIAGPTPDAWVISSPAYVIRTPRAAQIAPEVRALVRSVAPEAPMYRVYTMAGLAADSMVGLSFTMLTLGITALLALVLGAVGLYGVLSSVVAERTREIGVRMALGAEAKRVRAMVVAQGSRVVLLGVLIGTAAALAITRTLGGLLFGVEPIDVATFVTMSAAMLAVGLLASYVPARRASSVDPIQSLTSE